ncbi:MAG: ATP-binding cassette domain-containing protein [Candidatus Melainabacteria bacterium]|nr:ATP-binding cassette domain-containing protein [Candidatus Melainabacteria bacterium]
MSLVLRKLFTCAESDSFGSLRKTIQRAKPSDIEEDSKHNGEADLKKDFITLAEYEMSLRFTLQTFQLMQSEQIKDGQEVGNIQLLEKLINSELMQKYKRLLEFLELKGSKSDSHPKREFIDIESEDISGQIDNWVKELIKNCNVGKENTILSQDETNELEALAWLYFDSLINGFNAKSLEEDIKEFLQASNYQKSDIDEQVEIRKDLLKNLEAKYPLQKDELEILVDLVISEKDVDNLLKTMIKIWNQYELGSRKGTIAKIMASYFLAHTIHGITPYFFQYGIALPTVGLLTGNGISAYFDLIGELNDARLMNDIRSKINKRISQSLIFNKYRFTQDRSLGEIVETLDRGKEATIHLVSKSLSMLLPQSFGIGAAFTGLMLISPVLFLINCVSIPITFLIGNVYNNKISPIHRNEIKAKEKVANELASVKDGVETILTSPHTQKIERSVKDKMDELDKLTLERLLHETKMRYAAYFTFSTTQILSSLASLVLHFTGKISEGAVFSNVLYAEAVSDPFKDLVDKICKEFPRHRQDVRMMEKILGESDKLDLPDGEKEEKRVPVSALSNLNISIKGLKFKNILNDINLDIHEGDFVTIAGPSGIGKSTLLRNIAGLEQPDSGSIKIGRTSESSGINTTDVKKYGDSSIYSIMAYSNQDPYIFPEMTLRENIVFYSECTDDESIKKLLGYLNLHKFTDKLGEKINHFSGGEQVRVGLARALYTKPKILLLDEPTGGLDLEYASEVRDILKKIHEEGTTIICVTHDKEIIDYSLELKKKGRKGQSISLGRAKKRKT